MLQSLWKIFILITGYYSTLTPDSSSKVLDRGLDNQDQLQNLQSQKDHYKLHLYQRVKMQFNQNSTIFLYYGLNNERLISYSQLDFVLDLSFNNILINLNNQKCTKEDNCYQTDGKRQKDEYKSHKYQYFNAKGYLGVNKIRPGDINVESNEDIENFYQLPIRFYDNLNDFSSNVLGLGPKSPIWNFWRDTYHFPGKHINFTICYNKENEYVMFDSFIDANEDILFKVNKNQDFYKFSAKVETVKGITIPTS